MKAFRAIPGYVKGKVDARTFNNVFKGSWLELVLTAEGDLQNLTEMGA